MAGLVGVQDGAGEFPLNLIGREMQFWVDQNLPYPEEICAMWDELVALSTQDTQEPWIEEAMAKLRVLKKAAAPLSPELWHARLAQSADAEGNDDEPKYGPWGVWTREEVEDHKTWYEADCSCGWCDAYRELHPELAEPAPVSEQSLPPTNVLGLTQPNPPRIASLRVSFEDATYNLGFPVYLKEDGDWKYNESATIRYDHLPAVIRRLQEIQWEIEDQEEDNS